MSKRDKESKRDKDVRKACSLAYKGLNSAVKHLCNRYGRDGSDKALFAQCLLRDEIMTQLRLDFLWEQSVGDERTWQR